MTIEFINCAGCKAKIAEEDVEKNKVVFFLNRMWHRDHIQCIFCKLQISDNRYFRSSIDPMKPSCYACHIQTNHPSCTGCSLPVIERGLVAFNRLFHIDCFRCAICNKTIPQRKGFYERDMMFYDDVCYMLHIKDVL
ncbi:LIM zinc-binding domain-containing protein [Caenorhabditis elegans]|uniref:LIM zinc-binding domain-containing protein n=1 Tax=Caenorhabditis elegans TaxID=6239 RepID=Q18208_CAEEL|nr:LIM zinc-binding domain-containing protein [Caenorhabditis elegans]CAA96598.1 LIM zinc-binding domain-containing protein [Caenorhabditis elegans]|eukprot:NP_492106.1 Uncharacterized protein CELE_C26C6.6 [Caenorhabditis elegans]